MAGCSFVDLVVFWGAGGVLGSGWCHTGEPVLFRGAGTVVGNQCHGECSFGEPMLFWGAGALAGDQ